MNQYWLDVLSSSERMTMLGNIKNIGKRNHLGWIIAEITQCLDGTYSILHPKRGTIQHWRWHHGFSEEGMNTYLQKIGESPYGWEPA